MNVAIATNYYIYAIDHKHLIINDLYYEKSKNYKDLSTKVYILKLFTINSKNYLPHIKSFLGSLGDKQIIHCNSSDFQSYLDNFNFTSTSQQNQVINAIRFLYKEVLNKKYDKVFFKRPKSEKKLPKIIDHKYIIEQLSKINNIKHKKILSLVYSVGLRLSEVINIKIEDIDSKRMLIHIKNAKGKKDRIVPLSDNILILLRKYYKEYHPKHYLFNGQKKHTIFYK